ncbi:hypothetical protein [Leuconostoc lactis]|uniref:hypothetical protein n=1 Tax=Leuconostoc lactis TaxID=1246 RepID=UPI0022E70C3C|nr:hypothetical protein [Leuconostoc lactis]
MKITGERALENITASQAFTLVVAQPDQDDIALDALFEALDTHIADPNFIHLALTINGGIAAGGTTLTLETNVINLPQRYTNQLKKLIWPEKPDNDVNLYMIVENPLVSQSQLKIALASSVTAYQDDPDSVKSKIAQWFTAQLQVIVEQQTVADAEITED